MTIILKGLKDKQMKRTKTNKIMVIKNKYNGLEVDPAHKFK